MSATPAVAARWRAAEGKRMSLPVLFVIDDDTGVMNAIRDDLSRRFAGDFRVVGYLGAGRTARWLTGTSPWRCSSSTTT